MKLQDEYAHQFVVFEGNLKIRERKLETTGHEIIKSIHPHPTVSEAIMEAVAAAYGEVIHI